jgi:hypothetical protein
LKGKKVQSQRHPHFGDIAGLDTAAFLARYAQMPSPSRSILVAIASRRRSGGPISNFSGGTRSNEEPFAPDLRLSTATKAADALADMVIFAARDRGWSS